VSSFLTPNRTCPDARTATLPMRFFALFCSATVFLSAFLLFLVEPLFAKVILPWFGGSAAVWSVCLVFFQGALLLGYLYADATTRLRPRVQVWLHIGLLLVCFLLLPLSPSPMWRPHPGEDPAWRILGLLTVSLGIPYILLSATSPLLQTWYARSLPKSSPYHLFALSNTASLLALLSYPFVVEPRSSTHIQEIAWSIALVVFLVLCTVTGLVSRTSGPIERALLPDEQTAPTTVARIQWLALSAGGSMLLLSITNHLTQNVAPVPLLWVLPLALYLLTFALAFSRHTFYQRPLFIRLLAIALGAMGYAVYDPRSIEAIQVSVPLFCGGLFICCMFCHGELNRLRPVTKHLTSFYLTVALGGAIGSILIGLAAPHVFDGIYEFPLTLLFTAILAFIMLWDEGWISRLLWACVAFAMCLAVLINIRSFTRDSVMMARNFYGALRVTQTTEFGDHAARMLYHGTIRHGAQFLVLPWRKQPTTYYSFDSGIGLALRYCCNGPKRVGVIGLGTGTLAAYGKTGDYFRFYEINPEVVNIANSLFTYIRESPARTDTVLGDARLSLEHESPQQFDVLAVDAFSGDAIPVHLLTKESVGLYLRHLKPNGILAIHTSNSFLALDPVAKKLADAFNYPAVSILNAPDEDQCISTADWVLITRNKDFLSQEMVVRQRQPIASTAGLRLWTDDYNNLFEILRPIHFSRRQSH
jgi:hypothetical protein